MRLEQYRKDKGKTQTEMGNLIGVSQAAIHRYETSERIPEPEVMAKIFDVTGGEVAANDFYNTSANAQADVTEAASS